MRITQEKMDAIAVLILKRYCELEPSFETVLKDEFSIEI